MAGINPDVVIYNNSDEAQSIRHRIYPGGSMSIPPRGCVLIPWIVWIQTRLAGAYWAVQVPRMPAYVPAEVLEQIPTVLKGEGTCSELLRRAFASLDLADEEKLFRLVTALIDCAVTYDESEECDVVESWIVALTRPQPAPEKPEEEQTQQDAPAETTEGETTTQPAPEKPETKKAGTTKTSAKKAGD